MFAWCAAQILADINPETGCFEHPCAPGHSCLQRNYSTFCTACPALMASYD